MKKILWYLFSLTALLSGLFWASAHNALPLNSDSTLVFRSALMGSLGGCIYCLRSVYLHACVHKDWDKDWETWFFIRPIISCLLGGISLIFLKAGLFVLEANVEPDATSYGFLAIAFIAGYNVDNFLKRIEEIGQSTWGVKKSNASNDYDKS